MNRPKTSVVLSIRERSSHLAERDAYTNLRLAIAACFFLIELSFLLDQSCAETTKPIDEARARTAGIRKLTSKHLVLYTDAPSSAAIDRLPTDFDKAVPPWTAYFGIDPEKTADWQPRAFLVADRRRFAALGLLPPGHEEFENGITIDSEIWLRDQPTDYYRRHLLLHEGTHAFMIAFLGGCGPGWYMEGTAELLGTHRVDPQTGELTLGIMPRSRDEVPMLGRVKLIDDAVADHRTLTFPAVMQLDNRKQLGNEAYAWCWAAAKFLDSHPRYRDRFHALRTIVQDQNFNDTFRHKFDADWADLNAEWQAFIATLDYGFDFDRMAVNFQAGKPLTDSAATVTIAADRGWQSSGVWLEASKSYEIIATGRYQIAADQTAVSARPWPCEPGGVTIDYHDGRPLGMLLGAIDARNERSKTTGATFADPFAIGLRTTIKPAASGTLYLRVNDSGGKLDDNSGVLTVTIRPSR
jgi:hypothetical protein